MHNERMYLGQEKEFSSFLATSMSIFGVSKICLLRWASEVT
jgi:hypothetical protein